MKPTYQDNFIENNAAIYDILLSDCPWTTAVVARNECFMAYSPLTYSYSDRPYSSVEFHPLVEDILLKLNKTGPWSYNVCFLNHYKDEHQHLGWHADDSPEMCLDHPIAVVSFGAARDIWVKKKEYKGEIPATDRYRLNSGSLFVMPENFQREFLHRIPKHDRPCGGRISLTFRYYLKETK